MIYIKRCFLVFIVFFSFCFYAKSASLKVSPARIIIHDVKPGKLYDIYKETKVRLTIYNDDDMDRTWLLSVNQPSKRGDWEKGYSEIPVSTWCWFNNKTITVNKRSVSYAYLFLKIPEEEKYYNQHWIVTLGIDSKPGAGNLSLAADIRVQIETMSKCDISVKPHGILSMKPGNVIFKNVIPGKVFSTKVELFNNDRISHNYYVSSLFKQKSQIMGAYIGHSYISIPNPNWLAYEKDIFVQSYESQLVNISLLVPDHVENFEKRWEDILFIESNDCLTGFIRIQIHTVP